MPLRIEIAAHPLLDVGMFVTRFSRPLGEHAPIAIDGAAPLSSSEIVKTAVRDLLRAGGFKPAGRSKPASEYLAGTTFPRINAAVDACNLASLHSGLPISLVDLDRVDGPLRIAIAPPESSYVFNPSGQTIDASGLICLFDAQGPTGTPVKDAQRTKTHDGTRTTLSIIWGTTALPGHTAIATRYYQEIVTAIDGALCTSQQSPGEIPI
jgi:DNA/RNA-binding domain of Phe-tRNA-synthetase-like protein